MKLNNKLKLASLGLAVSAITPVIALPLINATKVNATTEVVTPTNIPSLKVYITERSYYEVDFVTSYAHPDWGVFGRIFRIHIGSTEKIDKLSIPGTVVQQGKEYKVRTIETYQRAEGNLSDIMCLDFSQAAWLDSIADKSFAFVDGNETFRVRSVDFRGAHNLRYIGNRAFNHQFFDNTVGTNNNIIDLSGCTNLEIIDDDAFYQCCDDDKNVFNAIIFPPTLWNIGKNAFSTASEPCRIKFKKIIFTNPNPTDRMFEDGIPRVADKNGLDICVPFGCKDKYIKSKYFDRTYSKNVYESTIKFSDTAKGTPIISSVSNTSAVDEEAWVPVDAKGTKVDSRLYISPVAGDGLGVHGDGHIFWKEHLINGEYKLRVYSYMYDDAEHKKLSFACSDEIKFSRFDCNLTGGSTYLTPAVNSESGDTGSWTATIDDSDGAQKLITDFQPEIAFIDESIKEKVGLVTTNSSCRVIWGDENKSLQKFTVEDIGQHVIILKAIVKNGANPFVVYKKIFLNVGIEEQLTLSATVTYENKSTKIYNPYKGEEIKLGTKDEVKFTINTPDGCTEDPQLSIENITPKKDEEHKYSFTFNPEGNRADPGKYQFYAHIEHESEGQKHQIYSEMFNITVAGGATGDIVTLPSQLDMAKDNAGSQSLKLINSGKTIITSVMALNAPWVSTDSRLAGQLLKFEIDPDDTQSILVSWDERYSPAYRGPIDTLDVMLRIYVNDLATNTNSIVHKALTVVASNEGSVRYTGDETAIKAYPKKRTTSPSPFKFEMNGKTGGSKNLKWDYYLDDETKTALGDSISIKQSSADLNQAYLECNLTDKTVDEDIYTVYVYAYDEDNITASYTSVKLDTRISSIIIGAPDKLELVAGKAGKLESRIYTVTGGDVSQNPTYEILGELRSHFSIEDNHLTWDDKLTPGYYEVDILSTTRIGAKEYKAHAYTYVNVTAAPKNNTPAIVGGTVGGTVAAGGAATGITLGVRKHKLLKGKKK